METIGTYLRQQREKAGVTLEHISAVTKVRSSLLSRLEADDFEALPTGVFLRGFVRAYADALRLPSDRPLELLDAQMESASSLSIDLHRAESSQPADPHGLRFKTSHLLVVAFALLAMLGAYFLASSATDSRPVVSSVQTTDVTSGTSGTFSPLKQQK